MTTTEKEYLILVLNQLIERQSRDGCDDAELHISEENIVFAKELLKYKIKNGEEIYPEGVTPETLKVGDIIDLFQQDIPYFLIEKLREGEDFPET